MLDFSLLEEGLERNRPQ